MALICSHLGLFTAHLTPFLDLLPCSLFAWPKCAHFRPVFAKGFWDVQGVKMAQYDHKTGYKHVFEHSTWSQGIIGLRFFGPIFLPLLFPARLIRDGFLEIKGIKMVPVGLNVGHQMFSGNLSGPGNIFWTVSGPIFDPFWGRTRGLKQPKTRHSG